MKLQQNSRKKNLNSFSFNYQNKVLLCNGKNCDANCSNVSNKLRYLTHSIRTEKRGDGNYARIAISK